jgi:anti-sigma B factor antagonist
VDSSIQVGVSGPTVWVKVEGKGSFLNSGNLKEFAREMLDRGYREFVVDLEDCAMMDSTFMGTMASVALRLKELGHGHLHIVHCGNRSQELLSGLGLDQIFDIRGNGSSPPECGALEQTPPAIRSPADRKKEQTETMLAAHEALCEAAPENILRFKDVLKTFITRRLRSKLALNDVADSSSRTAFGVRRRLDCHLLVSDTSDSGVGAFS